MQDYNNKSMKILNFGFTIRLMRSHYSTQYRIPLQSETFLTLTKIQGASPIAGATTGNHP